MDPRPKPSYSSSHLASLLIVSDFSAEDALKEAFGAGLLSSQHDLNVAKEDPVVSSILNLLIKKAANDHLFKTCTQTTTPHTSQNELRSHSRQNRYLSLKRKAEGDPDKDISRILNANVASKCLRTDITVANIKHTPSPWRGLNHSAHEKSVDGPNILTLKALLDAHPNMKVQAWNGRQPMKIIDKDERVIVHLAGRPKSKSFERSMRSLDAEIHATRVAHNIPLHLSPKEAGIRGDHPSGTYGYTYPSFIRRPTVLKNGCQLTHNAALSFETSAAARRVKDFQAAAMKTAAPRMYQLYCETDRLTRENCPELENELRNMLPTIDAPGVYPFASTTYNFGPQTQCRRHRDCMNFPCGWCAITSMGSYNPRYGGHLVLWELDLIIEFPPHSTVLIPSALITHSNTAISHHESRMSIVRYTAGGLFMWTANGCRPASHPLSCHSPTPPKLKDYLNLFMNVDELNDQRLMFKT